MRTTRRCLPIALALRGSSASAILPLAPSSLTWACSTSASVRWPYSRGARALWADTRHSSRCSSSPTTFAARCACCSELRIRTSRNHPRRHQWPRSRGTQLQGTRPAPYQGEVRRGEVCLPSGAAPSSAECPSSSQLPSCPAPTFSAPPHSQALAGLAPGNARSPPQRRRAMRWRLRARTPPRKETSPAVRTKPPSRTWPSLVSASSWRVRPCATTGIPPSHRRQGSVP
mmetsp:Transcript_17312/g.42565  ORF Transcript_17312/g.42565 Transcript_17312/m.42565 type:complete len:229 (+) Transcript_17312:1016-1702(+)